MRLPVVRSESGQSIIQVIIASGILATVMLAAMTFFANQTKANNFLEFQAKREQLRLTVLGQFLNQADNCRCLFQGAANFPTSGAAALSGVTPASLGRYSIVTPGVCPGTPPPAPWIGTAAPIDGLLATNIALKNIVLIGTKYSGDLTVALQSAKDVLGPKELILKIPVSVQVSPGPPGTVAFESCSSASNDAIPLGVCPPGLLSVGYDPSTLTLQCQPPVYQ